MEAHIPPHHVLPFRSWEWKNKETCVLFNNKRISYFYEGADLSILRVSSHSTRWTSAGEVYTFWVLNSLYRVPDSDRAPNVDTSDQRSSDQRSSDQPPPRTTSEQARKN